MIFYETTEKDFLLKFILNKILLAKALDEILEDKSIQDKFDQIGKISKKIEGVRLETSQVYDEHSEKRFRSAEDCAIFRNSLDKIVNKILKEKFDPLKNEILEADKSFNNIIKIRAFELGITDSSEIYSLNSLYRIIQEEKPSSQIDQVKINSVDRDIERKM